VFKHEPDAQGQVFAARTGNNLDRDRQAVVLANGNAQRRHTQRGNSAALRHQFEAGQQLTVDDGSAVQAAGSGRRHRQQQHRGAPELALNSLPKSGELTP
jgi:hypothetical protein